MFSKMFASSLISDYRCKKNIMQLIDIISVKTILLQSNFDIITLGMFDNKTSKYSFILPQPFMLPCIHVNHTQQRCVVIDISLIYIRRSNRDEWNRLHACKPVYVCACTSARIYLSEQ